jgi:hypothetical protein
MSVQRVAPVRRPEGLLALGPRAIDTRWDREKLPMPTSESKPSAPLTAELLYRSWQAFFYQSIGFTVILLVASEMFAFGGQRPEWEMYSMIAGAVSLMPSFVLLPRYRDLAAPLTKARRDEQALLEQVRGKMMMGMVIGDLPAFAGFLHYVFTGDVGLMFIFCVASNIVIFVYKPPR